jgi:GNAT superfamily N-acetyltransferase
MTDKYHGVAFAKPEDAPEVYQMMVAIWNENALFSMNEHKAALMCASLFDPRTGMVGIIRGPEKIEGAIGLRLAQQDYSDDWYLAECFNYVRPDHRKSDHAKRLILFAKTAAEQLGIPLFIGIVSTQRVEAKMRLYRRQLTPVGGYFMGGKIPRLAPEVEAVADREEEEGRLLDEYRTAVDRVLKAEKNGKGNGRHLTREQALEKLKAVHDRAGRMNGSGSGHEAAGEEGRPAQ